MLIYRSFARLPSLTQINIASRSASINARKYQAVCHAKRLSSYPSNARNAVAMELSNNKAPYRKLVTLRPYSNNAKSSAAKPNLIVNKLIENLMTKLKQDKEVYQRFHTLKSVLRKHGLSAAVGQDGPKWTFSQTIKLIFNREVKNEMSSFADSVAKSSAVKLTDEDKKLIYSAMFDNELHPE